MTRKLALAMAQINPIVGDLSGNSQLILDARATAKDAGADLVLFSEMVMVGYPAEDLVLKPFFQDKVAAAVNALAAETSDDGPALIIGTPWRIEDKLYNVSMLLDGGEIKAIRPKHELPNYGVFDEKRVFSQGPMPGAVTFRDVALGIMTCEDMWMPDVSECLEETGAEILLVPNGSPFETDKIDMRMAHAVARVKETGLPLVYVNQVGGQDELVFDGASFALGSDCKLVAQLPNFESSLQLIRWEDTGGGWHCVEGSMVKPADGLDAVYKAMVLGLRDYVNKNGFPGVVLGMSGGIDSALSAAVAVDALGAVRVHCVMMPSPYTSQESLDDADIACKLLDVKIDSVNIKPAMDAFDEMLAPIFGETQSDTTEENIQARARGLTLMAISNKNGAMVLTTGNKSEMSVGYATLYGDMCGGYSVLKDIYKMDVFALCRLRNAEKPSGIDLLGPDGPVMPERIITKPPSAELRPDQRDDDSLPPYDKLDDILKCLIEGEMGLQEITKRGHNPETVQRVWRMLDLAEYKRRQAPPGVKVTSRAFGKDRRYPITNAFRKIL